MAKQFLANRSGQTPTLDEVPNETIKIYPTEAAADADLANLEENEIFATDEDNNPASGTQYPVDVVQDGNMNAVTSNAVYDYVTDSLEWVFAGRAFYSGATINVPISSREIKMIISNTGSTITSPELTIPTKAITTSSSDEKLTAWQLAGTNGSFTISGNNIAIYISSISSSYIRIWYR